MRWALLAGLGVVAATPLAAQRRDSLPPIDTDRPDFTDGVHVVQRRHLQLEIGYTHQADRGPDASTATIFPDALIRIGMNERIEARVGLSFTASNPASGPGMTDRSGSVGGKIAGSRQRAAFPAISYEFATSFPLDQMHGAGDFHPAVAVLLGWEGEGPWSLGAEVTASRTTEWHAQGVASISLQYQLITTTQLYGELYTVQSLFGETSPTLDYANSGILVRLSNSAQLDARLGVGLNHAASRYFAGAGFAVRW